MSINKNEEKNKFNQEFIINKETHFEIIEAYNRARINLLYTLSNKENNIVLFSSCHSGEGKTTTCINMGISFSQIGKKVLIIDGDMRKPSLQKMLNLDNECGLSSVLGGFNKINDCIRKDIREKLDVLPSGHIPPNPTELLSLIGMENIFNELKKEYDIILIDSPPINVVSDALYFNKFINGIVFVLQEYKNTHKELRKAIKAIELSKGKIIGFIKVGCKEKKSKYYKNNYYS